MSLQLVRILDALPDGFEALRRDAEAEGWRHMTRLADDWASGAQRFDAPGAALFAARLGGRLAAVGGLTPEPAPSPEPALRLRRVYVAPDLRRQGVGMALCNALLQEALDQVGLVTVHAPDPQAAAFWEAQGFVAQSGQAWSHAFRPLTSGG